ncbi:MAG: HAMP domain-containing protein [Dehalococcoidia bacterium]|nr:HAMP domain-containing protein [Dehalococcoidia bacterium]
MSWTRKLLPRSLRSRLILSFGILIFLSLFLAGTTTVYLLRAEQEKTARERVGRLAEPIALRAAILEASGATPADIETALQEEYDVRILLVDRQAKVVSDTGETLRGMTINQVSHQEPTEPPPRGPRFGVESWSQGSHDLLLFTAPFVTLRAPGFGTFIPGYQTVVAVEESDVKQAWRDLLPRLFLAGGIAFFASVFAAGLIARSITRPLRYITTASEEMAQGRYDQRIPSYGGEEVGRLAQAFNDMAHQVGTSYRTLREFLANVSHELKTPLTSIQGFSQAMTDGSLKTQEEFIEASRIINDEAIRMRGLVDDLLYLSQVEAGEVVLHFDKLSPNDLIEATAERFDSRAGQADVRLLLQMAQTPSISADARRLEQALANIVDNAVRHTPRGGSVTLRSTASNGHVQLAVHNTGSVIPPEALRRIFDRFFQVDPARARADGNTGLGLAITKEIIESHGGEVEVSSSAAGGTEFVITLPVQRAPEGPGEAES